MGEMLACRYARAVPDDPVADQTIGQDAENRQHLFRPLRVHGDALIVLVVCTLVATAARLVVPILHQGSSAFSVQMDVKPFVTASRILIVVTGLVFLAWFRRARINAGGGSYYQRFAPGWTFWGWIVPVVNLWIPLLVMEDIWQASFSRRPRGWVAWLPMLWWTSWIVSEALLVLNRGAVVALGIWSSVPAGSYGPHLPGSWPGFCVFAVAGLTLIAIVQGVSHGPLSRPSAPVRPEVSTAGSQASADMEPRV